MSLRRRGQSGWGSLMMPPGPTCGTEDASRFGRGGHVGSSAGSISGSAGAGLSALSLRFMSFSQCRWPVWSVKSDQEGRGEKIMADETGCSALSWSGGKDSALTRDCAAELSSCGFVQINGSFRTSDEAFDVAGALIETCRLAHDLPPLSVIGDFVLPPLDGGETRDFQTLHFDFGLPLDPKVEGDVACYTALHVPADVTDVHAVTRLVPLAALLGQRSWPTRAELVERLRSYGRTHGAWDDQEGYVEGSLARIVEAAAAELPPTLPSVKVEPGFLCGLEFDSLSSELAFFARHGLRIDDAEIDINLQPGELLLFDNLALAHGRRGARQLSSDAGAVRFDGRAVRNYWPKRRSVSRCSSANRRMAFARSSSVPGNPRRSLGDFVRGETVFELVLVLEFAVATLAS
jgi:hypothetical protein